MNHHPDLVRMISNDVRLSMDFFGDLTSHSISSFPSSDDGSLEPKRYNVHFLYFEFFSFSYLIF